MGYDVAPWIFKGRALYQLQLVKTEEARKYIPENFKLVECFGYTLGGFYLARYDDSPVGVFDELVALAGLVWNAPTSCAWAARVYVNHKEARDHGLKHVGLPSRLAVFKELQPTPGGKQTTSVSNSQPSPGSGSAADKPGKRSWWRQDRNINGKQTQLPPGSHALEIISVDRPKGWQVPLPVCTLQLPQARGAGEFAGPRIRMALPSFSGATPDCPELLKYACDLWTNVRLVQPAQVTVPKPLPQADQGKAQASSLEVLTAILGGKPLLAMAFDDMEMTVQEPERLILAQPSKEAVTKKAL